MDRIKISEIQPKAYTAMYALEKYLGQTDLDPILKELIKNRVSQINGCEYCMEMHTKEAIRIGETIERIDVLRNWENSNLFNEKERAVLALAEQVTAIGNGLSDEVYNKALDQLGETQLAQAIMAIITINSWNRIGISTHM